MNTPSGFVHPKFREGDLEEYRKRLIRLSAWGYLLNQGLIFVTAFLLPEEQVQWQGVYALLGAGFLTALAIAAIAWERYRPEMVLSVVALAVVQIGILIAFTGRDKSPFYILYFFVIILDGAFFTGKAFIATIFIVTFGWLATALLKKPIHLDLQHYLLLPIFIAGAIVTNLLFKDLQGRSIINRRQAKHLNAIYEASRILNSESSSESLFQTILEVAVQATDARYAAIRTFNESGALDRFYHIGLTALEEADLKEPPGDTGILGAIKANQPPVRMEDLSLDSRHRGFPPKHPLMKSLLGVPIVSGERLLGKLYLTEKAGGHSFTAEDEALVVALAGDAATAIEKAYLLEKIRLLSITDGLTGFFNNVAFRERLQKEIELASRYNHPCSLLMVDVDNFKRLNDTYGHPVGDLALTAIAGTIKSHTRKVDFCARYGGEEFAILLPETGKEGALTLAEGLRGEVEKTPFRTPEKDEIRLSISIGAGFYPDNAESAEQLIKAADKALYHAKNHGKNRVSY